MKLTKKIAAVVASGMIAFSSMVAIPAYAVTVNSNIVDNDEYGPYNCTFYLGFSQISGSNHRYGTARVAASSNSSGFYKWEYPTISVTTGGGTTATVYLKLYLNDSRFNDRAAHYTTNFGGSTLSYYVNQSIAPSGWSGTTYAKNVSLGSGSYSSSYINLVPSGYSGYETGADSVRLTVTV